MTLQSNAINAATCSIGVVTYLGRFEISFRPLLRRLALLFPDYEINVFINGHYDIAKQVHYLMEVTRFLQQFGNVRYLTNVEHQSLARGWNWLILMSTCDNILVLNDDVIFTYEFRYNLEKLKEVPDIFLINDSWSHFVINKKVVRKVSWFDERFVGLGCEDHDYTFRLAMKGIIADTLTVPGIWNQSSPQVDPGWAKMSAVDLEVGRHTEVNRNFLKKKWYWSDYEDVPEQGSVNVWYPAYHMEWTVALKEDPGEMPHFYPLSCLDGSENYQPTICQQLSACFPKGLSFLSRFFWKFRRVLRLKSRWRQLFHR